MIFRTRDLLVRQRTQLVNALRGHLAEHGIAAQGLLKVKVLAAILRETAGAALRWCGSWDNNVGHIARLDVEVAALDRRLLRLAKDDETFVLKAPKISSVED